MIYICFNLDFLMITNLNAQILCISSCSLVFSPLLLLYITSAYVGTPTSHVVVLYPSPVKCIYILQFIIVQ